MKKSTRRILLGSTLALTGLAWIALIQVGMGITHSSLISSYIDQIDPKRTDFNAYEIRILLGRFAGEFTRRISPVWPPAIPISIGFFLIGSGWQIRKQ